METIAAENLLKGIESLTPDQRIFVDFPTEISNRLELLTYQIQSAEKLFNSFMSNSSDTTKEFNLNRFLTTYAELVREKEALFRNEVEKLLGTEAFDFCSAESNKVRYCLDFQLKKLIINKVS